MKTIIYFISDENLIFKWKLEFENFASAPVSLRVPNAYFHNEITEDNNKYEFKNLF